MGSNKTTSNPEPNIKLERISRLLAKFNLDGLLLRKKENFAWSICGGDSYINIADSMGITSLLITRTNRFGIVV